MVSLMSCLPLDVDQIQGFVFDSSASILIQDMCFVLIRRVAITFLLVAVIYLFIVFFSLP